MADQLPNSGQYDELLTALWNRAGERSTPPACRALIASAAERITADAKEREEFQKRIALLESGIRNYGGEELRKFLKGAGVQPYAHRPARDSK